MIELIEHEQECCQVAGGLNCPSGMDLSKTSGFITNYGDKDSGSCTPYINVLTGLALCPQMPPRPGNMVAAAIGTETGGSTTACVNKDTGCKINENPGPDGKCHDMSKPTGPPVILGQYITDEVPFQ